MSEPWRAQLILPRELIDMASNVRRNLLLKILPNALDAASLAVKPIMEAEIADKADGTESRKLQTAASRAKFPHKLSRSVIIKRFKPRKNVVLRIVGVSSEAAHGNFDHGDKALGVGRKHILWGKGPAKINPRKQIYDISKIVAVRVEPAVVAVVDRHIQHAISTGELLKP